MIENSKNTGTDNKIIEEVLLYVATAEFSVLKVA